MKSKIRLVAMLVITMIVFFGLVSCVSKEPEIQLVENSNEEPEYLSFFSPETMSGSDLGKYWSERFAEVYNKKIYINYDGAAYYSDEGLSYRELLEKRMESSQPDDLYVINAEDVMEFEKKGYWMDLSQMDLLDNLSEAALYQSTYKGKVFSIPLTFTGFGFLWNVDMLKEYGLSVPQNLEEFLNVCETLKAAGILPYGANKGYSLTVPAMCIGMEKLYSSPEQEQRIVELNSGKVQISSYMREGFQFLQQMIEWGYLDPEQALATNPEEEYELFLTGKCGFICTGMNSFELGNQEQYDFQMELTGLPVLENGSIAVYGANTRLCVNPKSKQLDTALKFMKMVGTKEALDESAELKNMMSTAKDSGVTISSGQQKFCDLLSQPGQIPNQDFALHFNTWENIRNIGRDICDGISIDEACEKADEMQRLELEKGN